MLEVTSSAPQPQPPGLFRVFPAWRLAPRTRKGGNLPGGGGGAGGGHGI